jgi:hypothetical protein
MSCNFKKEKSRRPSWVPELCRKLGKYDTNSCQKALSPSGNLQLLGKHLASIFRDLENLDPKISSSMLRLHLLMDLVNTSDALAEQIKIHGPSPSTQREVKLLEKLSRDLRITDLLMRFLAIRVTLLSRLNGSVANITEVVIKYCISR